MEFTRASGILLHPTSFPGPHGIGDLGENAYQFVDFLVEAKQSLWQILPLGPTSYGNSPYASLSSVAGNPLLVNLDKLVEQGDLNATDLDDLPDFPVDKVDYEAVIRWKVPLLEKAAHNFLVEADAERKAEFEAFCAKQAYWLDDFALYVAVKQHFDQRAEEKDGFGARWHDHCDNDIFLRKPKAVKRWLREKAEVIAVQKVLQFYFFQQWTALREYANEQGIKIIGDIPIFVAPNSADAWANSSLFLLDKEGQPTVVAGVPPDYFSKTGQLWGNPLYDWEVMASQGFQWWIDRIRTTLQLIDIIRIDHFRGFEAYWAVPGDEETAINGKWVKAPGKEFFEAVDKTLGHLPILAEDLGIITPEVEALRDHFEFPGMKVLHFAFSFDKTGKPDATNPYLPHNHVYNAVVYTGTHDNNTTKGWYGERTPDEKDLIRRYLARPDDNIVWDLIRMAMASVARYAIVPFQDALSLDSNARMNTPSIASGNWAWRYRAEALNGWVSGRLRELAELYGRDPAAWEKKEEDEEELEVTD